MFSFTVPRVIWVLLALIHAWPWVTAALTCLTDFSATRLASLLLLSAASAFFWAKAFDVSLLRTDRPWLELGMWLLAGALMHPIGGDHAPQALLIPASAVLVATSIPKPGIGKSKDGRGPRTHPGLVGFLQAWSRLVAALRVDCDKLQRLASHVLPAAISEPPLGARSFARVGLLVLPPPSR
ncbi:MAG: hypothetical protein AAGJ38_01810 [Planctomycetota bacterium]